ncbi:MAG TPA: inositol monophosphatase [Elusimicrobia bacterium]|nr:inositol monophosphatase [Elusimicrobiota bacterium]
MKELSVLHKALAEGGKILSAKFGKVGYRLKGRANLLTEADLASQKIVKAVIHAAFPEDAFMAEEDDKAPDLSASRIWVIDPLDGTTNYAHGFPAAAVSIALLAGGEILVGGVLDPFRREVFTARRGGGAFLNGRRLAVSKVPSLSKALLTTGFAYDRTKKADFYCSFFSDFMKLSHDVRRMGVASLDLAWLAAGRIDGYWEFGLKPWDVAAGKLLVEEAGGRVSDFSGGLWTELAVYGSQTLATNGLVHMEMLGRIKKRLVKKNRKTEVSS